MKIESIEGIQAARALLCLALLAIAHDGRAAAMPNACLTPASWHVLTDGKPRTALESDVLADMARRDVVLLGEHHDNADHHRWQLQTLAALHLLRPNMVIGFEAFPRRVQPVLDQWVAGELSAQQFLERAEWQKVWNYPPELYLPLFQFARLNRVPMIALNVERTLIETVGKQGFDAVPNDRRENVSRPARPSPDYETYLFEVYKEHAHARRKDGAAPSRSDPAFGFFVESQTTWDRAMAEALFARSKTSAQPKPIVVGIMGAGHVQHGHGVPHQLRDLGMTNVGTFLALAPTECSGLKANLAHAVFAVPQAREDKPPPPRLGVRLETVDSAVRITDVTAGSLAEQSGIRAGDEVATVAGRPVRSTTAVVSAVRLQPAGTWLPLQVRRAGGMVDLVIKFPP